jgi:cytochrome c-type biogenesis protein CcmF
MDFIGEHLLPGKLGHFFLLLSFIASLGASVCYFLSVQKTRKMGAAPWQNLAITSGDVQWKKLARIFFLLEVISVFAVFGILFYIISNHLFEYKYAYQHSSRSLETKYLLSCFWEGQEGSFLLWSVWHCILGMIFIWREKEWEAPVMSVVSFAQVLLATMLIGLSPFGLKMGSNPFELMRNSGMLDAAPIFHNPDGTLRLDYLSSLTDGRDLNVLLQNYWMVIHPPVLFLGFASTIIPFSFAIAGLWTKRFTEWTKAALPWSLFSAGILGLGIMMGAAWAYESLNFGGYWAWDPVENASLVPWLVLVAGIHTLVIFRHTGNALRTTYLFFILCFVLVLYSTYLTRSGDLQDTSVHAFTGEGITVWHLRILLLIFMLPAVVLLILRYKSIPFVAKEEETSSREFWMFIGSLVIFLSALLIIGMTSIPVVNKLLHAFGGGEKLIKTFAVGEESAYAYNRIQIFVAIILALFTGFGMYLKYKSTGKPFLKKLIWPTLAGLVVAGVILAFGNINYEEKGYGYMAAVWIALAAAVYSVITNGTYIFTGAKGKIKKAGGAIAHTGFAMLLTGILISSSKKEVLSYNTSGVFIPLEQNNKVIGNVGENMTLIKGMRMDMGKYWVTFEQDSLDVNKGDKWFYKLHFLSKDKKEDFALRPNAFVNHKGDMGLSANPDARHYWNYDVFTYITSLPNRENKEDTTSFKPQAVKVGDTVFYSRGFITLDKVVVNPTGSKYNFGPNDTALVAELTVHSKEGTSYQARPALQVKGNQSLFLVDSVFSQNLAIAFTGIENNNAIRLQVKESEAIMDFITIKAYKFPFINLVWLGTIIMVLGFFISALHRRDRKLKGLRSTEKGLSQKAQVRQFKPEKI